LQFVAVALLVADIVATFIADRYGLSLSDQQHGILLGLSSIVLFFLSFEIGLRKIEANNIAARVRRHYSWRFEISRTKHGPEFILGYNTPLSILVANCCRGLYL
jgi:site-specific recombinase